jgi:hypothetical protein
MREIKAPKRCKCQVKPTRPENGKNTQRERGNNFKNAALFEECFLCFYSERLAFGAFERQDLRRNVQKGVGLKRLQVARS